MISWWSVDAQQKIDSAWSYLMIFFDLSMMVYDYQDGESHIQSWLMVDHDIFRRFLIIEVVNLIFTHGWWLIMVIWLILTMRFCAPPMPLGHFRPSESEPSWRMCRSPFSTSWGPCPHLQWDPVLAKSCPCPHLQRNFCLPLVAALSSFPGLSGPSLQSSGHSCTLWLGWSLRCRRVSVPRSRAITDRSLHKHANSSLLTTSRKKSTNNSMEPTMIAIKRNRCLLVQSTNIDYQ